MVAPRELYHLLLDHAYVYVYIHIQHINTMIHTPLFCTQNPSKAENKWNLTSGMHCYCLIRAPMRLSDVVGRDEPKTCIWSLKPDTSWYKVNAFPVTHQYRGYDISVQGSTFPHKRTGDFRNSLYITKSFTLALSPTSGTFSDQMSSCIEVSSLKGVHNWNTMKKQPIW